MGCGGSEIIGSTGGGGSGSWAFHVVTLNASSTYWIEATVGLGGIVNDDNSQGNGQPSTVRIIKLPNNVTVFEVTAYGG